MFRIPKRLTTFNKYCIIRRIYYSLPHRRNIKHRIVYSYSLNRVYKILDVHSVPNNLLTKHKSYGNNNNRKCICFEYSYNSITVNTKIETLYRLQCTIKGTLQKHFD